MTQPPMVPTQFQSSDLELVRLKQHVESFHQWLEDAFKQGGSVIDLVHARSDYLDALLTRLWQEYHL